MANPGYVRFSDGVDTNNGSTWTLANKTAAGAMADAAAGDRIWFSNAHAETQASAMIITSPGTISNPCHLLCGDDATEPPTTLSASANIATTGASAITISGFIYCEGINFIVGSGAVTASLNIGGGDNVQVYRNCSFQLAATGGTGRIRCTNPGVSNPSRQTWLNCDVKFGATGHGMAVLNGELQWSGGSVLAGGSTPTTLFENSSVKHGRAIVRNVDFSNLASTFNFVMGVGQHLVLTDCKLPASWSGSLLTGTLIGSTRVEMYNCDSGDTNYLCWIAEAYGQIKSFTTLYLSGTDGIKHNESSIPVSYKMAANSNTGYPLGLLNGMPHTMVNETTSFQTATLEIIHNESAALNDDEIWLEVDYPATAGSTQFTRLTDAKANVLASAAAQTTSTTGWDDGLTERANSTVYSVGNIVKSSGTSGSAFICTVSGTSASSVPGGYTSAADGVAITDGTATFKAMRRQKLTVTFTAAEQGVIRARPVLAKANAVVWTASKLSVT